MAGDLCYCYPMPGDDQLEFQTLVQATRVLTDDWRRRGMRTAPQAEPIVQAPTRGLQEIRSELGDCRRCKLHKGRRNLVFGVGDAKADLAVEEHLP